jgi:CheY-like chemotaxis protein
MANHGKYFPVSTPCRPYVYHAALMHGRPPSETAPLILIADDNVDTREMYALYLNMVGYRVETAEDGHEAIIKARTLRPDLVVMDLQMPNLDGWGAIRELQGRKPAALAVGAGSFQMTPCFPERLAREVATRLDVLRNRPAPRVISATE